MLSFFFGLVVNQVIRVMMDLTYTCSICFPPAVTLCPFLRGFHRYLRRLLLRFSCAGPLDLLEFKYRWDIWMAAKNRGLPKKIGACYERFEFEII